MRSFDEWVVKPYRLDELLAKIEDTVRRRTDGEGGISRRGSAVAYSGESGAVIQT